MKKLLYLFIVCLLLVTVVTVTGCSKQYTVEFRAMDGTVLKTEVVEEGCMATAPEAPEVENYTFSGWDVNFDIITEDTVVTATYTENEKFYVTFEDYDGTEIAVKEVYIGKDAIPPEDPVRDNYTFKGWKGNYENVTGDLTVKATYTENQKFTVVFKDYNGKTLKSERVYDGKAATAPADPTRVNYTFAGWDKDFDKITESIIVTATYTENEKYTVTFEDYDGAVLKTEEVYVGTAATAPAAPSRENHVFLAWSVAFDHITGDTIVTATYTENTKYTVTFVDHDDSVLKTEQVYVGTSATAPVDPTRAGYRFTGWDKTFDNVTGEMTVKAEYIEQFVVTFVDHDDAVLATVTVDKAGAAEAPADPTRAGYRFTRWDKAYDNVTESLTVKAEYIRQWTVTFVDDDGVTVIETVLVDEGSDAEAPADPTRTDYKFTGWEGNYTGVTADITITATYVRVYTVTFRDHDGTVLKTEGVEYGRDATAPANPTRQHYTFTGWDKTFTNVTEDIIVSAQYTENAKYTVTFVDHDGTTLKTEEIYKGEAATAPANPTRQHYTFAGWDKVFNNITEAITVTALYKENPKYSVMQWAIGEGVKTADTNYANLKATVAAENPDFLVMTGINTNDFNLILDGYTKIGYGGGVSLSKSCNGHFIFYKTDKFTVNGSPMENTGMYINNTNMVNVSYLMQKFTVTEDQSDIAVVSAYFKDGIDAQITRFKTDMANYLTDVDFAITAIHVETSTETDTLATYQEKFTYTDVDKNGMKLICNTGVNVLNDDGTQLTAGRQHFEYIGIYSTADGSIETGTAQLVNGTDNTTTFKPTSNKQYTSDLRNAFHCEAYTTVISATPKTAE